jgi:hypothetical protein
MKHHLVTFVCLMAAVLCYVAGSTSGMLVLVAAGLVLESVFWFRIVRHRSGRTAHKQEAE